MLLRIGSANVNNRSMGFDTECDLSLEGAGEPGEANRREIAAFRTRLLAHWLGCDDAVVAAAIAQTGGVRAALEGLRLAGYTRIRPIEPISLHPLARFIADYHLGDPVGPGDSWRRQRALQSRQDRAGTSAAA